MSAFEVKITPTRPKKCVEGREPTTVVMAPFSAKAIVQFEDVPLTKTAKRILRIDNPSNDDIEVKVTKPISDLNVTIDWMERTVAAQSVVEMEMIWCPQLLVACKETMQLSDNRNFRKDVMVILKSKCNNAAKNTRKFPTISSSLSSTHAKTLRLKSPTGTIKISKVIAQRQQQRQRAMNADKVAWNINKHNNVKPVIVINKSPLSERNVYTDNRSVPERAQINSSPLHDDETGDSVEAAKENISPLTPNNIMSLIDKMKFTPLTETRPKAASTFENLHSPTQANVCGIHILEEVHELRPRRITATELTASVAEEAVQSIDIIINTNTNTNTTIITNKTFEVQSYELDITGELSISEGLSIDSNAPTLNKTTIIASAPAARQLEMIQEEDPISPPVAAAKNLQKTYLMPCNSPTDLKRDIKLVGTPLRKYSASMRELSLNSPQTKYAIQGSMPNLNEMESIRSIEQNRYFYQRNENAELLPSPQKTNANTKLDTALNDSVDNALHFNQHEILAQSSRFNLNEVGVQSRKNSPLGSKSKAATKKTQTPPKAARKLYTCGAKVLSAETTATGEKRRSHELSFSDSHSNESLASSNTTPYKSNKLTSVQVSPPKRQRTDVDATFLRPTPANASATRSRTWSQTQPKKFKLVKTLSLVQKPITPRKAAAAAITRIKLYDSELYLQQCINPDPFAATTTCDPFLASTMYLDERAVDNHIVDFKKWLNALVSLPAELNTDCNAKIDVGKLFNEVRHKELQLAPSKEQQSLHYLNKFRLESLRRAAVQLFMSEAMREPCSKVAVFINKNAIRIRSDRNLHLDVVMQRYILELLLCFNPLWLRLGLEVVYGEQVNLHSNSDIVGLSTFILNRLFKDKFLEQKYSKAYTLSDEYAEHIKKFTLQKMLFLLLFLDKAKEARIIKHNPCLFVKRSPHKETREILLRFSSELLANIGDISRELKRLGYVLQHKQTYLDEFDYAFHNLAVDLRDGIRLTRVMEVILLRDDLTKQLRVPAISRLQRVYNVNLALRALNEADFQLSGDITAAEIVDGHREKTLSLLWQIIYKFRSPKFHAAARVLQKWWRKAWLRIVVQRRIQYKEEQQRAQAATVIQTIFRGYVTRKYARVFRAERTRAAIALQKYARRYLAQTRLAKTLKAIVCIQQWYRRYQYTAIVRRDYLHMRNCTIFLQRSIRRRQCAKRLLLAAEQARLQRAQKRDAAAACIQQHVRAYFLMQLARKAFLKRRNAALILQRHYRAKCAARIERNAYLHLRSAAIVLQRRYRARKLMIKQRAQYLQLLQCIIQMQRRRRALLLMRVQRGAYLEKCRIIITMQRRQRAKQAMRHARNDYLQLKKAAVVLQRRYRARLTMKAQQKAYEHARNCITYVQQKWRATRLARQMHVKYVSLQYYTLVLQQKFRATRLMRIEHNAYQRLRAAVLIVQRRYRSKLQMRTERTRYQQQLQAIIVLQRRYRAYKQMRVDRAKYRDIKAAAACLQQFIRGFLAMKRTRFDFQQQKHAAIVLQRCFRAHSAMRKTRQTYLELKAAAILVQQRYRGKCQMRQQQQMYVQQRQRIICVQQRYRAKLVARAVRKQYTRQRTLIIRIQRRMRATLLMRQQRAKYLHDREQIIKLQRYYRGRILMQHAKAALCKTRAAAIRIQCWYRSVLQMRCVQQWYRRKLTTIIGLQRKWRATMAARRQRRIYLETLQHIKRIQELRRATLLMRSGRTQYKRVRSAAIVLQRRYRARLQMLQMRSQYLLIRSLVIWMQRKFRAHRAMLIQRQQFLLLRSSAVYLQQKYRGKRCMQVERARFMQLRCAVLNFQTRARGYLARKRFQALMTPEMCEFLQQKRAVKFIQRYWRGYRVRKRMRNLRILQIRSNIAALKETSSVLNSIRHKVNDAVYILRGRFNVSEALHVLRRLERLSRTVPHLLMPQADFISTFCYGIMAQAIRSEVDKQLIEHCSRIILNLARSNSANTFQEGGLATIAQILLRWCDKDSDIFNTLCTLIWIFAHCPQKRQIIRNFMTTPEAIYVVRETKKLVARKEKMKQNVRKPIAAARSGAQHNFSSRALPSLEPDYGVIHNKPYIFISSVYAFDTILCRLEIDTF